jgi:hypothetical protein
MSWEVTTDDIELILQQHGKNDPDTFDKVSALVEKENARIEKAVLYYTDFDEQTTSMLDEIENILIENKIITGPKKFSTP